MTVDARELTGRRLDRTTSYGDHQGTTGGGRQRGQSTAHRPDLPPLQRMAAAAEPSGPRMAGAVPPGQGADAPLDTPLRQRVRGSGGRPGWRYAGAGKRAARATRAESAAHPAVSLRPLPLTGETATPGEPWGAARVDGAQEATRLWDGARGRGAGDEFARPLGALVDGAPVCWTARVQVVRLPTRAQRHQATLEKRLAAAAEALRALTPAPGRGQRQRRDEDPWQGAMARVLDRHDVAGLLPARGERHETTGTCDGGRGRGGPARPPRPQVQGRSALTDVHRNEAALAARRPRWGWRVQGTHAPVDRLPLPQAVRHERGGGALARDCPLVQALPLGRQPLLVWKEEPLKGLPRLLPLARRLLTLLATQGRRGLEQTPAPLAGLYEGSPTRTTERPTGTRLLTALARAPLTLTRVEMGGRISWHLTLLAPLHEQLLRHLHLPTSLYTALADNAS